ncbi:hypothetical protein SOCEGT47_068950 [Sorangium cellulosum]|uniref:DUF1993 domain-containing protein n=1 Tax=Sorangium cellulosum TaxID=56 RepID=A0A4P2Q9N6_SORCE|nr:DUF1993 domain-containing protein [Sorangium cellulosum]AUX26334.1 hypothetical protein SOCEGT47_068950 [Sorangium cellulosum]
MNLYDPFVPQLIQTVGQARKWLDKAQALAEQKKFDVNVLLSARLAPDQHPLVRQLQMISDGAKFTAARLAGVTPPVFEDNEKTVDEVRARLDKTIAFLKTIEPAQLEGADARTVTLPFAPGKGIKGIDFLVKLALPNFYFHATTAYAILRHNGVDVGKVDFLGELPFFDV